MLKSSHLVYLALVLVVGLLASLVTMVAMNTNPLAHVEPAHAQAASGGDIIAVPIQVTANQEFLAVITRPRGAPNVRGGGATSDELALAIYEMHAGGADGQLRWMGTRRIHYDLMVPAQGLHRDQLRPTRGADYTPAGVREMIESWAEEQSPRDRRRSDRND